MQKKQKTGKNFFMRSSMSLYTNLRLIEDNGEATVVIVRMMMSLGVKCIGRNCVGIGAGGRGGDGIVEWWGCPGAHIAAVRRLNIRPLANKRIEYEKSE